MKYYLAPMEGITNYIYRNAYHRCFYKMDKYFSPFMVANQKGSFRSKELSDLLPENNQGIYLVPQILTNNAGDFIQTSKAINELGYNEININLGCPSGTVVAKNRGSGFLSLREELNQFLDTIFSEAVTKISIKTRLGKDSPEEFPELLKIFNQYPLEELIIHPRIQKDYYKNKPNLEMFEMALSSCKFPVVYNGDIFRVEDYNKFVTKFPLVQTIMLGRGVIGNPSLVNEITNGEHVEKKIFKEFHNQIYKDYQNILYGDRNILFKMKEFWFYMIQMFSESDKYWKKIKKVQRLSEYEVIVENIFSNQEIIHGRGFQTIV